MTDKSFVSGTDRAKRMLDRPGTAEAVAALSAEADEADRVYAMNLAMIREAGRRTQTELAHELRVSQGAVSQLEKREDMLWSTLRNYLTATGATDPRIVVSVNGRDVTVQF